LHIPNKSSPEVSQHAEKEEKERLIQSQEG